MLKVAALVVGAGLLYFAVDNPKTRAVTLNVGRSVAGFVNKNSKVTDEYLRCMELNPKQPEACNKRLSAEVKSQLPELKVKATTEQGTPDAGKPCK